MQVQWHKNKIKVTKYLDYHGLSKSKYAIVCSGYICVHNMASVGPLLRIDLLAIPTDELS